MHVFVFFVNIMCFGVTQLHSLGGIKFNVTIENCKMVIISAMHGKP